jgi:hypothetical protein
MDCKWGIKGQSFVLVFNEKKGCIKKNQDNLFTLLWICFSIFVGLFFFRFND